MRGRAETVMQHRIIAYLVSEYPGISHTFVFREVQVLRTQGFEVKTASFYHPEDLERMTEAEKADGATAFYLDDVGAVTVALTHLGLLARSPGRYVRMVRTWAGLLWGKPVPFRKRVAYFAGAGVLAAWMRKHGIRHVHVHLANAAVTVAIIASGWGEASYSMSVHGPDVFSDVTTNLLAEKVLAARFVRCISHFCRSQLMRLVPADEWGKLHIVRCGVDVSAYAPRPEPGNDIPELLCVGRLVPAKGQHILVEACKELRGRGLPFHLTFVGDGPDRASLEARTRELGLDDAITFAGAVGQDEIHAYYDRADVFVLASFAEGLPVVLMEAMAKEIPCVATRIVAIPELVLDGVNGLLVAPSDATGLADAVERLISDPDLRRRFGEAARQKVLDEYDNAKNCPAMGLLFEEVLTEENRTEGTGG